MTFRITWNRPATSYFIDEENDTGVQIRIVDGAVQFRPTTEAGDDVAPINDRSRGGIEVTVNGAKRDEILEYLNNDRPYYLLRKRAGGWIEAVPWQPKQVKKKATGQTILADSPLRSEPHIRVWVPKPKDEEPTPLPAEFLTAASVGESDRTYAIQRVLDAYREIDEAPPRRGRPTRKMAAAKQIVAAFETNVTAFATPDNIRHILQSYVAFERSLGALFPIVVAVAATAADIDLRAPDEIEDGDPDESVAVAPTAIPVAEPEATADPEPVEADDQPEAVIPVFEEDDVSEAHLRRAREALGVSPSGTYTKTGKIRGTKGQEVVVERKVHRGFGRHAR